MILIGENEMRHDNSYRRAKRNQRQASMTREAAMVRVAELELKVAAMEYQAGMTESLKGMLLKYVVNPINKFRRHLDLFTMPVDDLMDDVIEAIAPEYAEKLMEVEVDADFEEFEAGAKQRNMERAMARGGYKPELDPPRGKTPEYIEGYEWGDVNELPIPNAVKRRIIEEAAQEHDKKVVERSLKKALNVINPVEIIKHAFHIIKKYGWDADADKQWYVKWPMRFFKVVVMAIAVAIVETIEHYLLPATMVKLTGDPAWWGLASIPLLEIIMPVVVAFFKSSKGDVVDEPGHLDWYEENYGEIENALRDENAFRGRRANRFGDFLSEYVKTRHTSRVARGDLDRNTAEELTDMIEYEYEDYGLDGRYAEIEETAPARSQESVVYHIVSLEGYYGILSDSGGDMEVEMVSNDWNDISRSFKRWTK